MMSHDVKLIASTDEKSNIYSNNMPERDKLIFCHATVFFYQFPVFLNESDWSCRILDSLYEIDVCDFLIGAYLVLEEMPNFQWKHQLFLNFELEEKELQ